VSLLYVPAILLTAIYFGTGAWLTAARLAVAQYDFFIAIVELLYAGITPNALRRWEICTPLEQQPAIPWC
jgi:hypothetical protein